MNYLYGPLMAFAFLIGSFIVWRKAKEEAYDEEQVFDAIVVVVVMGLIGGRIHFGLLNYELFGNNLIKWVWITKFTGLRWPGGLIGGILGLSLFTKKAKWDFWPSADLAVFGLALGQMMGKIGCFFNEREITQIYEAVWLLLIYILLLRLERSYRLFTWYQGKKDRAEPGFLGLTYLILYHYGRVILEIIRGDSFLFSLIFVLVGCLGLYRRSGRELSKDIAYILTILPPYFNKLRYRAGFSKRKTSQLRK